MLKMKKAIFEWTLVISISAVLLCLGYLAASYLDVLKGHLRETRHLREGICLEQHKTVDYVMFEDKLYCKTVRGLELTNDKLLKENK